MIIITLSELIAGVCIIIFITAALWEFLEQEVTKARYKKVAKEIEKYIEELYIEFEGSVKELIKRKPSKYTNTEWRNSVETYLKKVAKDSKKEDIEDYWK